MTLNGYFSKSVELYTTTLCKEYTQRVVNETLLTIVLEGTSDKITKQVSNLDGNVVYSYVDTKEVNRIRTLVSEKISNTINTINDNEEFDKILIPYGYLISKNYFLSNGIRVPVNLEVISNHKVDIDCQVLEYGINSSVIEIDLIITIDVLMVIPFIENVVTTINKIPLSIEVINSEVPKYYFTGTNGNTTLILDDKE